MSRYLFLDIDGVLNGTEYFKALRQDQPQAIVLPDRDRMAQQIDPAAVARLNRLTDTTKALIVISSTWRFFKGIDGILFRRGVTGRIVGRTPSLENNAHGRRQARGLEIQDWLHTHKASPADSVILDDEGDMAHLLHRLIQTPSDVGLQDRHVDAAIRLFGE